MKKLSALDDDEESFADLFGFFNDDDDDDEGDDGDDDDDDDDEGSRWQLKLHTPSDDGIPHKVFARPFGVERSLSRLTARAVGWPALGSGIRPEAPLAPSLAMFDRPAATPGT